MPKFRIVRRIIGGKAYFIIQQRCYWWYSDIDNCNNWGGHATKHFESLALAKKSLQREVTALKEARAYDYVVFTVEDDI